MVQLSRLRLHLLNLCYNLIVIWCSLTISFSSLTWCDYSATVVIWCSLTMSFSRRCCPTSRGRVVIWCSLTMSFSHIGAGRFEGGLWFDALWQCLSVLSMAERSRASCDLMLFDNVFQCKAQSDARAIVVIWCSLTMSFSYGDRSTSEYRLWFDALWQCLSVQCNLSWVCIVVVIWCSLTMSFSALTRIFGTPTVVIWCSLTMSFSSPYSAV